ncbi:MAG: DUF3108 domain-containing protein [Bacteroidales bacterium]
MNRFLTFSFLWWKLLLAPGVGAQCDIDSPTSFLPGEFVRYEVAYNWGYLWVNAGEVYFRADTLTFQQVPCWTFESYGTSYKFYDWLFKVRDHFQSKVTMDSFQPIWFQQNTYEGGYTVNNRFDFDPLRGQVIAAVQNSNKPLTIDTLNLPPCTFDVLSAIYHTRNLRFDRLNKGEKVPVKVIIDNEFFDLYIRYLGKEPVKTRDGKIYDCIKFSALLVDGTIFKGGEDLFVWITDDENKIPVMAEAKILIGSVKAYLIEYRNLKEELKYR